MAVKAPPPELIPDWQYTLDEDARFYSWTPGEHSGSLVGR
jgi:hypothetical protein